MTSLSSSTLLTMNKNDYVDYKDAETLRKFLTPHARIQSRRRSKAPSKNQRQIALAIKRARFLGLLPYVSR